MKEICDRRTEINPVSKYMASTAARSGFQSQRHIGCMDGGEREEMNLIIFLVQCGRTDHLVNNAGVTLVEPIE